MTIKEFLTYANKLAAKLSANLFKNPALEASEPLKKSKSKKKKKG